MKGFKSVVSVRTSKTRQAWTLVGGHSVRQKPEVVEHIKGEMPRNKRATSKKHLKHNERTKRPVLRSRGKRGGSQFILSNELRNRRVRPTMTISRSGGKDSVIGPMRDVIKRRQRSQASFKGQTR